MTTSKQAGFGKDLLFLLPLVLACLVAYLRFPLFQLDDHLAVIREIARTGSWPAPDGRELRMAQHPLFHHTSAALVWRGMEMLGESAPLRPDRAAQALSLVYALAIIPLLAGIVRIVVDEPGPRRMAFVVFGTFTGYVFSSVTVSNEMALGFWGTAAFFQLLRIMRDSHPPRRASVLGLGILLGTAALIKMNAPLLLCSAVICFLARVWFYREKWGPVLRRSGLLILVFIPFCLPSAFRFPGTVGVNPQEFRWRQVQQKREEAKREPMYDIYSFRLSSILIRPYQVYPYAEVPINRADYSFWSSLFISNWQPPHFLPDPPTPILVAGFSLIAMLITAIGLFGFSVGVGRAVRQPVWFVLIVWPGFYLAAWLFMRLFLFQPGQHIRHLLFSSGSQVAVLALGFQALLHWRPGLKRVLWILIILQVGLFWLILLGGPFYSLHTPWPQLMPP